MTEDQALQVLSSLGQILTAMQHLIACACVGIGVVAALIVATTWKG